MACLFGTKIGMTRIFTDEGAAVPVTVIQVGENVVTQLRTKETDGYTAVQVGFGDIKPRRSTMPVIGHDAKAGVAPQRHHGEFRVDEKALGEFALGQTLDVKVFENEKYVDVTGTSKGKGFQGTMKRHNFKGYCATHGTERKHRAPGSIGGHASNRGFGGGLKKGKRMAGHMGDERVTLRSLDVVRIDAEQGLLLVKGPVPGPNRGTLMIKPAVRINRSKQKKLADAAKG